MTTREALIKRAREKYLKEMRERASRIMLRVYAGALALVGAMLIFVVVVANRRGRD